MFHRLGIGAALGIAIVIAGFAVTGTASAATSTVTLDGNGSCLFTDYSDTGVFTPSGPVHVTGVKVEVDANDVDSPSEVDNVSLNIQLLGTLIGSGGADSTTTFNLTPAQIAAIFGPTTNAPVNLDVDIDVSAGATGSWCVEIKEVRIIITTVPASPTTANDCKNGGWKTLVDAAGNKFKNQGDCVSYVATLGRNTAAGDAP